MRIRNAWLLLLFSLLCIQPMMGQQANLKNDTIYTFHFRVGKSDFNPQFRNNAAEMNRMIDQLDILCAQNPSIKSIKVSTSTSPEGGKQLNVNLASSRSHNIVSYLMRMYPRLTQQIVISSELAPDWDMLRDQVCAGNMPMRKQVLDILDLYRGYYNPNYATVDPREVELKKLNRGQVWKYMLDNYYPDMRYAKVTLHHDLIDTSSPLLEEVVSRKEEPVVEPAKQEPVSNIGMRKPVVLSRRFLFALKTNLLYDAIAALNAEIEVPLSKKWSVQAEVIWPWYVHNRDVWCYEGGLVDAEIRYWPKGYTLSHKYRDSQNPLTGFFIGLTGGSGYYDVSDHSKGYQGELWDVGMTLGYSHRLWHNFNMEYSLGVGYVHSKYRRYHVNTIEDERYLVRNFRDTFDWVGPIKAKVSLSWLIFNNWK